MSNIGGRGRFMRLYNIYYICKLCEPVLNEVKYEKVDYSNGKCSYKIIGWGAEKRALKTLSNIKCLSEPVKSLYATLNPYEVDEEAPTISAGTYGAFVHAQTHVYTSVNTIISLYESLDRGESQSGIDVKIPACNTLKEYMGYLKDIDFIFTQCPFLLNSEEKIQFDNVDVGSQWLTFIVVSSGAFYVLNNLAKLVQKAIALKSNYVVLKQQEEELEAMRQKNKIGQEMIEIFEQMKRSPYEKAVTELEEETGIKLENGEDRGKVTKSLEKLSGMLVSGVEIYSSIETPKEVKVLFPVQEELSQLPDGILKLIEEKENTVQ